MGPSLYICNGLVMVNEATLEMTSRYVINTHLVLHMNLICKAVNITSRGQCSGFTKRTIHVQDGEQCL